MAFVGEIIVANGERAEVLGAESPKIAGEKSGIPLTPVEDSGATIFEAEVSWD